MKIEKNLDGEVLTLSLEGRLDTLTTPDLEKEVSDLKGVKKVIFDFEKLEYISSSGLRVLLATQKIMNNQGEMVIKNSNMAIKKIFNVTGFADILTVE
jgi:anti-sigma B factor antagonist